MSRSRVRFPSRALFFCAPKRRGRYLFAVRFRPRRALWVTAASLCVLAGLYGVGPRFTSRAAQARPAAAGGESGAKAETAASPRLVTASLTADGADRYDYSLRTPAGQEEGQPGSGLGLVVTAPTTNLGVNLREVGWIDQGPPTVDAEYCVTWTEFSGPITQAGVALRVRSAPRGAQAITVTNNILFGARNGWNIHLWSGSTGELVGQIVLAHAFGPTVFQQPPLPWRLCARTIGPVVEFKAWSMAVDDHEPAWTDPGYGGAFTVPSEWVYPGRAGWYVGHLRGGAQADYGSLEADPLTATVGERLSAASQATGQGVIRSVAASLDRLD